MTTSHEHQNKISLPFDAVMEILRRVRPPKSLVQLQLECKEWQAIIRGPRFEVEYHDDGAVIDNYNIQSIQRLEAPPGPSFGTLCSLNGFIVLVRYDDNKVLLWNPTICQVLELPEPHHGRYGCALSYVSSNRNYILLSVYNDDNYSGGEACEVINLCNGSRAWTRVMSFPYSVIGRVVGKRVELVRSGEEVHCVRSFKVGMESYREVVTVDIGNESYTVTCIPKGSFHDGTTAKALDWNGKLGLAHIVGENLHVLILEDYKNQKWSGNAKLIPLPFVKKENYEEGSLIPLFAENDSIRFWLKDEKVFTYNKETGLITHSRTIESNAVPESYSPHKQSIIRRDGMQPADQVLKRIGSKYTRD